MLLCYFNCGLKRKKMLQSKQMVSIYSDSAELLINLEKQKHCDMNKCSWVMTHGKKKKKRAKRHNTQALFAFWFQTDFRDFSEAPTHRYLSPLINYVSQISMNGVGVVWMANICFAWELCVLRLHSDTCRCVSNRRFPFEEKSGSIPL